MTEQHILDIQKRLADAQFDRDALNDAAKWWMLEAEKAKGERDRLRADKAELLATLEVCNQELADAYHTADFEDIPEHPARKVFEQARAAIAKAKEYQP